MKYLLILLCSLEILDGIITRWAVIGGIVREFNPLVAYVVADWYFLIVKAIGALLCALILWILYRRFPKVALTGANCVVIFYVMVLVWNSYTLSQI